MYPSHLRDMTGIPLTPHGPSDPIFSPPKTPAPGALPSLSPIPQFPNWSIDSMTLSSLESSPDYESSRPSTAHSTHTSASLLSNFSVSSADLSQCVSPETEHADHFGEVLSEDFEKTIKAEPSASSNDSGEGRRRLPWTKPMVQHLWSTYMIYLQDPKVTPFRLGKSGIPPHGVCLRVAREAKRSWKGSKAQTYNGHAIGSLTPTVHNAGAFVQWPHSCASTRAQLRGLCRMDARTKVRGNQHLVPSPTPYGKSAARFWGRRSASARARSLSVFSGQDMAMSLAVSTSDSMQLQGPLAQLTNTRIDPQPEELPPQPSRSDYQLAPVPGFEPLESERAQLSSPFVAHSYGPSSSGSLTLSFAVDAKLQRQTHTGGGPRPALMSPARLTRSRSTQKRRPKQPLFEPRRTKRPSLGSDLWVDPATITTTDHASQLPAQTSFDDVENMLAPRKNLQQLFEQSQPSLTRLAPLTSLVDAPLRLGSPFSMPGSSFSFPNRLSRAPDVDVDAVRRPFATVQQPTENSPLSKSSLASRLAYIDERLKDFRRHDRPRRRSESPL